MTRIRVDKRFSALCEYRYARTCGANKRVSYWFAVMRCGLDEFFVYARKQCLNSDRAYLVRG